MTSINIVQTSNRKFPIFRTRVDGDLYDRLIIQGDGVILTGDGTVYPATGTGVGATGADGAPGSVLYSGAGAPPGGTGINGDYYLNTSTNDFFGPKAAGVWPGVALTNLTGATGIQGPAGAAGATGATGLTGATGAPGSNGTNGTNGASAANIIVAKQTAAITAPTNTYVDIPGLSFAVVAGRTYAFEFRVTYQTPALTTGVSFDLNSAPAMTTFNYEVLIGGAAAGVSWHYGQSSTTPGTDLTSLNVDTINTDYLATIKGFCTPSASGTIQLRGRSEVAASAVIFAAGGICTVFDLDQAVSGGSYTDEQAQDAIAAAFAAGVHTDISVTYNDAANSISLAYTGSSSGGTNYEVIVASNDASAAIKAAADYTCNGTNDDVEINAAILDASALIANGGVAGGEQRATVRLTGGNFNLTNSVLLRTGVTLKGGGLLTRLIDNGITVDTGAGTAIGMIKLFDDNTHAVQVCDMSIEGNFGSGGTGHGVAYSSSGGSYSGIIDTNPDAYNMVGPHLYLHGFSTGTRHGIYIHSTASDNRGCKIIDCDIRVGSGDGIHIDGAPDGWMSNVHIGGFTSDGIYINGGNWRLTNCKVYFCDANGFNFVNDRMLGSGLEAQDCATGFNIACNDVVLSACEADTSSADGIVINGNRINLQFSCFVRGGGRYATQTNGIRFVGTPTDSTIVGSVNPANITNEVTGTTSGANNFIRIPRGAGLTSVG